MAVEGAEDARVAASQETSRKACSPPTSPVTLVGVEEEDVFTVEPAAVAATGDVAAQVVVGAAAVEWVVSAAHLPTSLTQGQLEEISMVIWTWVKRRRACKFYVSVAVVRSYPVNI